MNLAQWIGERALREDPVWSPMATPFPDFEGATIFISVGELLNTFNCGHPRSRENTLCVQAGKYFAERCRECARQRNTEYRLRKQQQRPTPVDVNSLVRVVALAILPCSVKDLYVSAFCGKLRAADVLRSMVAEGLALEQKAKFYRAFGAYFVRADSVAVPDEAAVLRARKALRMRRGHRGRLPKVADADG